jgi:tRNA (guanosine-2'-O-)-methyltransferase
MMQPKSRIREAANRAKSLRCKTLICVLENPSNPENCASVVRNVDALGIGSLYIISTKFDKATFGRQKRGKQSSHLHDVSASALKYVYVRVFQSTAECLIHLRKNNFVSVSTSPHSKQTEFLVTIRFHVLQEIKHLFW